jgi:enoyl-CoA hydratase/carnithine racemase
MFATPSTVGSRRRCVTSSTTSRDDRSVGLVVFTGAGEKAFVAGADIGELRQRTILDGLAAKLRRLYDEIESLEKPTIAAVNGYAFGGGCELAMPATSA